MHGSPSTVVIVDDEPEVLELLRALLRDEGYAVISVPHPAMINDLKGRDPTPHLFILDIMLPQLSGIELARILRDDGYMNTPMIAMSASSSMLQAAKQSALFQHTVRKPFDLDVLLGAVELHTQTRAS